MSQQLPSFFSYQAPGRIWQLKADLETGCLAIEVRESLQEASFAFVCPQQDKVIFEGLVLEGALLCNLIACHKGILLFQQGDDLEQPGNATTLALEAKTQEVLWAVSHYRHVFFYGEESIGKTPVEAGDEAWSAIDLHRGSLRELAAEEVQAMLLAENRKKHTLRLPAAYTAGDAHFVTVQEFLQLYLQLDALKTCEYLHVFDKMVISFYTAEGEKLANRLVVFDAEGNLLLHKIMAKSLLQPGSETFMVWQEQLFLIENSSCLKGYNLQ